MQPPLKRLRGLRNFVHDAVEVTTDLVEQTHESVAAKYTRLLRAVDPLAAPVDAVDDVRRVTTAGVFGAIRAVNEGVRQLGNLGHEAVASGLDLVDDARTGESVPEPARPADPRAARLITLAQSALNGIHGDFLRSRNNELDLGMTLCHADATLRPEREQLARAFPASAGRLCVFVHGLACTERAWYTGSERVWGEADIAYGPLLERDLGLTPLYARYNTGVRVSDSGAALAALLDDVVAAFPVPVTEVTLIGHSMGGLVCRSAAYQASRDGRRWTSHLRRVVCLGSPHLGVPLERATHVLASVLRVFDTPGTQVPAAVLGWRSAGVKNLRHGTPHQAATAPSAGVVTTPETAPSTPASDEAPHVAGISYYFVAATLTQDPDSPLAPIVGDLLVSPESASGRAQDSAQAVPSDAHRVFGGLNHLEIANHPDVYAQLKAWLATTPA